MRRFSYLGLGLLGILIATCCVYRRPEIFPLQARIDDCIRSSVSEITAALDRECCDVNLDNAETAELGHQLRQLDNMTSRFFEQVRKQVGRSTSTSDHAVLELQLSNIRVNSRPLLEQIKLFEETTCPVLHSALSAGDEKFLVDEYKALIAVYAAHRFWEILYSPFWTIVMALWPSCSQPEARQRMAELQGQLACRDALRVSSSSIKSLTKNVEKVEDEVKLFNRNLAREISPRARSAPLHPRSERQQVVLEQLNRIKSLVN